MNAIISNRAVDWLGMSSLPFQGVVIEVLPENNFGTLATVDGLEVYFLRSSVVADGFDKLERGSVVRFNLRASILGLQATCVIIEDTSRTSH